MKKNLFLLAVGICICSTAAFGQATTTVTTTKGAFTEYVPGSETVVVRSETGSTPLRYVVTKQTTIVDEAGAPVAIERISPGSPLSVQYTGTGERMVASRIVVQKPATLAPATSGAAVTEQQTTTTTTRPLTHEEKHALKEEREHQRKAEKKEKEALEKAKEKVDEDH